MGTVAQMQVTETEAVYELVDTNENSRSVPKRFTCVRYSQGDAVSALVC